MEFLERNGVTYAKVSSVTCGSFGPTDASKANNVLTSSTDLDQTDFCEHCGTSRPGRGTPDQATTDSKQVNQALYFEDSDSPAALHPDTDGLDKCSSTPGCVGFFRHADGTTADGTTDNPHFNVHGIGYLGADFDHQGVGTAAAVASGSECTCGPNGDAPCNKAECKARIEELGYVA